MVLSCSTTLTPWQIFRITITHNHSTLHVILQNQRKHVIQVNASVKTVLFSARKIQQMYPIKPAEREDSRVKARKEGFWHSPLYSCNPYCCLNCNFKMERKVCFTAKYQWVATTMVILPPLLVFLLLLLLLPTASFTLGSLQASPSLLTPATSEHNFFNQKSWSYLKLRVWNLEYHQAHLAHPIGSFVQY